MITSEVLFVNTAYMKRITQLSGAVDDSYIAPAILLGQDKYTQVYLGTKLFNKLKDDIRTGSLTGDYVTLMDDHVRKVTCWWAMVELIPNLYVQLSNGGLVIRTAENTAAINSDDLRREVERARNNAQFYTHQMYRYLTYNAAKYPEYTRSDASEIPAEHARYTQNGYSITGMVPYEKWREYIG